MSILDLPKKPVATPPPPTAAGTARRIRFLMVSLAAYHPGIRPAMLPTGVNHFMARSVARVWVEYETEIVAGRKCR